ncbi:MAG: hypothetical protein K2Y40_15140 [Reyranella sp.]|jgi:hypothetical protein|nr:hypothetical protein [Reyranella sp.]
MPAKTPVTKKPVAKKSAETLVLKDIPMVVVDIAPKVIADATPEAPVEAAGPRPAEKPRVKRDASTPEAKLARRIQRRIAQAFALGMRREVVLETLDGLRAKIAEEKAA